MEYSLFVNGEPVGTIPSVEIELKQDIDKLNLKELTLELDGEKYRVFMEECEFERLKNR